MAYAGQATGP